jgi:hypothetical protein
MVYSDGETCEGNFKDGSPNGLGKIFRNSHLIFEGELINGVPV